MDLKYLLSSAATLAVGSLFLTASCADGVSALSEPGIRLPYSEHPRSWRYQNNVVRHGGGELGVREPINSTQLICQNPAPPVQAPKHNVWGGLTDVETASVLGWLFHQKDLNLTASHGPPFGNLTAPPKNVTQASGIPWENSV